MNFSYAPEFKKDLKALTKKVRTLARDIERVRPRIETLYVPVEGVDLAEYRQLFFASKKAAILHQSNTVEVIKMRLDTDTAPARDKLRLIFIAIKHRDEIIFIELYAKNSKTREDVTRIKRYISTV